MIRFLMGLIGRPAMLGWALAGVMALVGGAYALGRQQGGDAVSARFAVKQARLQTQMIRAAELASRNEAARLAALQKVEQLTSLKMPHVRILTLAGLPLALTACAVSTVVSPNLGPPPSLLVPCVAPVRLPERALTQAEAETFWGRDRTALRRCGGRHRGLVDFISLHRPVSE